MRAERAALVRKVLHLLELLADRKRPPLGCGEHPSIRQCLLTPPARNPGEPLVSRTQACPACAARALMWHGLHRDPADEAVHD